MLEMWSLTLLLRHFQLEYAFLTRFPGDFLCILQLGRIVKTSLFKIFFQYPFWSWASQPVNLVRILEKSTSLFFQHFVEGSNPCHSPRGNIFVGFLYCILMWVWKAFPPSYFFLRSTMIGIISTFRDKCPLKYVKHLSSLLINFISRNFGIN